MCTLRKGARKVVRRSRKTRTVATTGTSVRLHVAIATRALASMRVARTPAGIRPLLSTSIGDVFMVTVDGIWGRRERARRRVRVRCVDALARKLVRRLTPGTAVFVDANAASSVRGHKRSRKIVNMDSDGPGVCGLPHSERFGHGVDDGKALRDELVPLLGHHGALRKRSLCLGAGHIQLGTAAHSPSQCRNAGDNSSWEHGVDAKLARVYVRRARFN